MRWQSEARATPCSKAISVSWVFPPVVRRYRSCVPFPASMRKRVELTVGLDLPPAMPQPVRLEHQESDDDRTDRDLAQEGDVGVQRQRVIDGAALHAQADPFHGLRQPHHEGGA